MASASFVLYIWIPSHEWLLVSTWPMNPGVPGHCSAGALQFPPGQLGPGTGQNLILAAVLHFQSGVIFMTQYRPTKCSPHPPEALLPHMPMSGGTLLKPVPCPLWDTVSPRKSKAAHEVPGFSEPWIIPPPTPAHPLGRNDIHTGPRVLCLQCHPYCLPAGPWPWASSTHLWPPSLCSAAPSQAWSPSNCASAAITLRSCPA